MNKLSVVAIALLLSTSAAFADDKPSDDEASKIKAAVAEWGCEASNFEKESEGSGVFEAEDVKCKSGQYDFRLDEEFKVFVITKD